uniref:SERPIN domain-containing protein n=1 Tax=Haemonchus contortus TaxID=6289 RepID=A0A7I4YM45_HAECO
MRFPCCVTILEIVILLCNGAEQGVLDSDVAELDGNDNTKELGNSLKANPTSDNTVITLDNFMDLLDTDKDIMDITKTDKSPTETDVEEVTQGRNDSLAASSRSPTEPEQVIPSMLRIMDDSRSNWTTTEATTTGFPPLEEINSTVTETTTHPMAFTIKDRFSEFDDLSSFKDISSGLDEMREQHKITEEPDPTITVPIPSDDDLQKTIIQNKSTVLNRSTSKNVKKNIVRYYVTVTRAPISQYSENTTTTSTTQPPSTPTTPQTSTTTIMKKSAVSSSTAEPSITIPLPENTSAEQKLNGVSRKRAKPHVTPNPTSSVFSTSTRGTTDDPAVPTSGESFLKSKHDSTLHESNVTSITLPLTSATLSSMRQPPLPRFSSSPLMISSTTKSTKTVSVYTLKSNISTLFEEQRALLTSPFIPVTSALTNNAEENLLPVSTTADASLHEASLLALPSNVPSQEGENSVIPLESSGTKGDDKSDSVEGADGNLDDPRYITVTVQPNKLKLSPRQRRKPSMPSLAKSTVPDLWWTPKPSYLVNGLLSTISSTRRTPTPSKELTRRKKVTSLTKSEKVDEAARGLAPLVPLARASAVGQFIYTTTIPPEFASIELHSTSGFNHRKTTHMNVPESHIQQLKSELEFLGVSDEGKPFAAMAPVRPPMHYGRARRKIVLTKEKREKSAPHPITRGYEIERKILNATVNEKLPDEAITVVSRGAKASHEPNNTPLQLSDEAITVVSRGMEAYGDKRNFNENNESVKGGLQSRPDREFVVAAEKVAKEPPSAPSSISPDINELEEALKELARLSKEVKDVAISDSVSFIGDYRDGISPVDGAVERKRRRRRRRGHGKGRQIDPDLGRTSRNTKSWSKKIPSPSPSDVDVERIARELEESSQRLIEQITKTGSDNGVHSSLVAHCTAIECNFEKGDLCGFVTSMPSRVRNHRNKRALVATAFFSVQRWANWLGKFNKSSLRVDRAPVFSPTNRHFAGTLLRAQQMATLTMQASTLEPFIISFDSWEATREMQMRVCCDDVCPLTTYSGSLKGERSWRRLALQCPKTTRTVTFECLNFGHRRGACGIDNFSLKSKSCYRRAL